MSDDETPEGAAWRRAVEMACPRDVCWKLGGHDGPCEPGGRPHPNEEHPMTTDPFIEREEAERERATWQESAEAADRERHDWQVRAVKAEDRAGEYHDTITALRTDLATALDRAEQPHTLTADDYQRAWLMFLYHEARGDDRDVAVRAAVDAALTAARAVGRDAR